MGELIKRKNVHEYYDLREGFYFEKHLIVGALYRIADMRKSEGFYREAIITRLNFPFIQYFDLRETTMVECLENICNMKFTYMLFLKDIPESEMDTMRLLYGS